jgi:hypothetical protein
VRLEVELKLKSLDGTEAYRGAMPNTSRNNATLVEPWNTNVN